MFCAMLIITRNLLWLVFVDLAKMNKIKFGTYYELLSAEEMLR